MLNPDLLNDSVREDIMQNMETDNPKDLEKLSEYEAFNRFLNWNGIIGYTSILIEALDNIREVCEDGE